MFNLNPSPTFTCAVFLSVPGQAQPQPVEVTYRHKTKDALVRWADAYRSAPSLELLAEVIADWGLRKDGEPVPYTPAALDLLCQNYPCAQSELSDAYVVELARAKRKN